MIKKFISKIKETSIKYRKGFFELSYTANSPEQIVNSSSKLSFIKHNKIENTVSSNTLFFKVELNYYKISEGLWLLYSESKYKNNLKLTSKYVSENESKENYYMLIFNVNSDSVDLKLFGQKERYVTTKYYWGFFKPENTIDTFNYKNSEAKYITICFNKDWLDKNLAHLSNSKNNRLGKFLLSDDKFILCSELNEGLKSYFNEVQTEFLNFRKNKAMNLIQIQFLVFKLINCFIERLEKKPVLNKNESLNNEQRTLILKIEKYLQCNLNRKFEGIDYLTQKFCVSETKLKTSFKEVFGSSVYQYFSRHQMLLAKQILKEDAIAIKEIAYKFGYDSPGKFSEAFKKQIGMLPSEIAKEKGLL